MVPHEDEPWEVVLVREWDMQIEVAR